jgi:hypothetical protein
MAGSVPQWALELISSVGGISEAVDTLKGDVLGLRDRELHHLDNHHGNHGKGTGTGNGRSVRRYLPLGGNITFGGAAAALLIERFFT